MFEMEEIKIVDRSQYNFSVALQNFDPFELLGKNLYYKISLLALLLLLTSVFWKTVRQRRQKLPPGPKGWPVVGCMFDITRFLTSGVHDLVKKYGPIVTLPIGSIPYIIIADAELAREAFIEKASSFSSRLTPQSLAAFTSGYRTISSSPYGPIWRALRKNLVAGLISSSKASSEMKSLRVRVVNDLVARLSAAATQNGGKVEVRPVLRHCMYDLLLSLCFGKQVDEKVNRQVAEAQKKLLLRRRNRLSDIIPSLRFLSWMVRNEHLKILEERAEALLPLIRDAKRASEEGKLPADCYVASLLAMDLEGEKISDDNILCLCSELLTGGTDTSVTCIEWALANVICKPEIQAKIAKEIESAVGKATVTEDDLSKLPYMEAVVMETLRRHSPASSTLPHAVSQPCKLAGYDIPANAVIFLSLRSIALDPKLWEDPLDFKPERFLGSDVDITGSKKLKMIPFGTGRRICPGLGVGMLHVILILARLVQTFEWSTEAPGEKIDLTGKAEFTFVMRTPLKAIIKPR